MGWCSGSEVWDSMLDEILALDVDNHIKGDILKALFDTLRGMDWDCDVPTGVDWLDEILYPPGEEDDY